MDDEPVDLRTRLERLERLVEQQRENITRQEQVIEALQTRSEYTIGRRGALQAGGLLGLLGLGATTASANTSGQIGTETRPLQTLHVERVESDRVETAELDGDVIAGETPITEFSESATAESVPVRGDSGELEVGQGTTADHAVTRGQAVLPDDNVDWSGDHDFDSMPQVGGNSLVESDSNSDGAWTRWADGTQMCYGDGPTIPGEADWVGAGTHSYASTDGHEFPVAFSELQGYSINADEAGISNRAAYTTNVPNLGSSGTSSGSVWFASPNPDPTRGQDNSIYMAIGQWS